MRKHVSEDKSASFVRNGMLTFRAAQRSASAHSIRFVGCGMDVCRITWIRSSPGVISM